MNGTPPVTYSEMLLQLDIKEIINNYKRTSEPYEDIVHEAFINFVNTADSLDPEGLTING